MNSLVKKKFSDFYSKKSAFVLNANAKSVTDRVVSNLVNLIPAGDLFYSRTMKDSETYYRTILKRGYARVFSGGGDGTLVNAINTIKKLSKREFNGHAPAVGVLKLGTGNAMASILEAKSPWIDVHHIVKGGNMSCRPINLVECDNGELAPFAGIGYDGEILNDYVEFKKANRGHFTERFFNSVFGYFWVGLTRTLPRKIRKPLNIIKVYSKSPAHKMSSSYGDNSSSIIPAGTLLYEGPSCLATLGSIPCYGYGFKMFPHVESRPEYMQLRVCAVKLPSLFANMYPSIWKGTYRHPDLHDFLVKDVTIECDEPMPLQIGGDAAGYKRELNFKIAKNAVLMAQLDKQRLATPRGIFGLLPAPMFVKN